jgi:hypothetical protein
MLRRGMALPTLMRLLGHKSITMTLKYAEIVQADVRESYFASIESLKNRYTIPEQPRITPQHKREAESIVSRLSSAILQMESLRRDEDGKQKRTKLHRLIRRLRKILTEFERLGR